MKKALFRKSFEVNDHEINLRNRLKLVDLLRMIQDTASEHASTLGFGYEEMMNSGIFWVLIRQKLKMDYWPKCGEDLEIQTWTKPISGIFAIREFHFSLKNTIVGSCSTSWMILDSQKRKPQDLNKVSSKFTPRTDFELDYQAQKILISKPLESLGITIVNENDLDLNNHVNNVKYSQWVMEKIPIEFQKKYLIKEYEINFLEETYLDEPIEIESNLQKIKSDQQEILFKASKVNIDKPVFISRMKLVENAPSL